MKRDILTSLFRKRAGEPADRGGHTARRRAPRGLSFEPLEERRLLATTAISNLLNVPVQFTLQSNSHLVEKTGNVSTDLGIVQGLYQGKDPSGTLVAYELVNNTLNEFVPNSPWVTVGTAGQSAQNANDNVFFTQGTTLFLATGVPGVKLPVLADVQSLSTAGTQAVVQVGPYLTANLTASLGGSSGTSLSFTNVQLNLGNFASNFLGHAIADLQAFTKPLQPLADDLETPFIAGSNFTTLWVMQQLGYGQAAGYAKTFADTVHAINALTAPAAGGSTSVNLGSFTAQVQSPTQLVTVGSTLASVAQVDAQLGSLAPVFAQLRSIPGLHLAIDDPQQLISLVTGGASTLFTYTLSVPQAISVSVQQQLAAIPVSPVTLTEVDIYANLGVSARAQATFGFDTTGYQAGNLANGFFIQNASLTASLTAGLSGLLNEADLAGYEITGAVTGSITASLHGANGSNKVYANQFSTGGLTFSTPNWNFGITSKFVPPAQMLDLAINQFKPYLKTLVGTDYQIAANIMNGKGVSPTDIAVALGTVYGIPPQTTAGVLKGLNKTASEVAGALKSTYTASAAQTAQFLSKAGFGLRNIAGALSGTYGLYPGQVANVLYNQMGGVTLRAVADALYNGIGGLNPGQVAYSLYKQMGGVTLRVVADALYNGIGGLNPGQVAYSLYNQMGGVNLRVVADALYNGIGGLNPGQVAYSLYKQMGGVTLRVVADALYNGIGGLNPGQVAYSLYNQIGAVNLRVVADALYNGIGGLNPGQVAYSLYKQMGGVTLRVVADALYNGIGGLNPGQVAYSLYNQMGGVNLRVVADALYNGIGGLNPGQVAYSLYKQMGGVTLRVVADALYNGIGGLNPGQVAYSLYNQMGGVNLRVVADALYNGIGGLNPGQVAYSLYKQMGGVTLRVVADALYNGIGGLNPGQVANSLYNQMGGVTLDSVADALYYGIGGLKYSQIAFSLFRQMGGVSVNDVASSLYYGLGGISWADALEIVESI